MTNDIRKATGIVYFLGIIPLIIIKKEYIGMNGYIRIHKTYRLFGFIPLFNTDRDLK